MQLESKLKITEGASDALQSLSGLWEYHEKIYLNIFRISKTSIMIEILKFSMVWICVP